MIPVSPRSVLCQYHGDCGHVCGCHRHRPSVSPSQPQQRTDASIGKSWTCKCFTFSGSFFAVTLNWRLFHRYKCVTIPKCTYFFAARFLPGVSDRLLKNILKVFNCSIVVSGGQGCLELASDPNANSD